MNVGGSGGGGFVSGYMAAKHPEAMAGLGVLALIGGIGYGVIYAIDASQRAPIADVIVAESQEYCDNAQENTDLYQTSLREELMRTWSSTLKDIRDLDNFVICMDSGLNDMVVPYGHELTKPGQDGISTIQWGEYRVTGVFYQNGYGLNNPDVLLLKPKTDEIPETSDDLNPDAPHKLSKVFGALEDINPVHDQVHLGSGNYMSVFIQQDGATQKRGQDLENHDDGFWADQSLIGLIDREFGL